MNEPLEEDNFGLLRLCTCESIALLRNASAN